MDGKDLSVMFKTASNLLTVNGSVTEEDGAYANPYEKLPECAVLPTSEIDSEVLMNDSSDTTPSSSNVLVMDTSPGESSPLHETHRDPFSRPRWMRYVDGLYLIIISMVVFSISITIALIVQIYIGVDQVTPHGGIVSSNSECSRMGSELLKSRDATTADAAILTALCLCILHPHAAGLGGGGFALAHNLKQKHSASQMFDFRESSPRSGDFPGQLEDRAVADVRQGAKVGVPGVLRGLWTLHQARGLTRWETLLARSASLARDGGRVTSQLAAAISRLNLTAAPDDLQRLLTAPSSGGRMLREGDVLRHGERHAALFDRLGREGLSAFYEGQTAAEIVQTSTEAGGLLTADDLSSYRATASLRVNQTSFADMKIVTGYGPCAGYALHLAMSALGGFPAVNSTAQPDSDKFLQTHRLVEVLKHGFGILSLLGNNPVNVTSSSNSISSVSGESIRRDVMDNVTHPVTSYLHGFQPISFHSQQQEYVTAIGRDLIAVTIVMELGSDFGSQLLTPSGVILNDAMLDFSWRGKQADDVIAALPPSQTNYVRSGARPMSSLLPVIAIPPTTKCGNYFLLGSAGREMALSGVGRFLTLLARETPLGASVAGARLHPDLIGERLLVEDQLPPGLADFLRARGHNVTSLPVNTTIGAVSVVEWTMGGTTAVVDPREGDDNAAANF